MDTGSHLDHRQVEVGRKCTQILVRSRDLGRDRVVGEVGFRVTHPGRREFPSALTETFNDRVHVIVQDDFDESGSGGFGNRAQLVDELATAEELRDHHVFPAAEMVLREFEREVARDNLGLFDCFPSRNAPAQVVDLDHQRPGLSVGVEVGQRRLPHAGRAVEQQEHRPKLGPCVPMESVAIYNQMVVDTELTDAEVDRVFHALADATRRDILHVIAVGEHNVSGLARLYPMSFAAVQKHVAVLADAGLVIKERKGREQLVRANPETIRQAQRLLDQLERLWRGRVDRMKALLAEDPNGGKKS